MPSVRCCPATSVRAQGSNGLMDDTRPLIAHVLHRFDTGGLENGVVNLINRLPADRFRHAVVALTEITEFKRRIERDDVQYVALHKPPGQGLWMYRRMRDELRALRPAIVHTRNLGALEMVVPAALAGVPIRIHGEHGWDINDPDGSTAVQARAPCIPPVRASLHRAFATPQSYLERHVGVAPARVAAALQRRGHESVSSPLRRAPGASPGVRFDDATLWLVGSVGRLSPVKDTLTLARAFVRALGLRARRPRAHATRRRR